MPTPEPWRVAVVVPARDEERRLPACLDALDVARRRALDAGAAAEVVVVVVLDRCRDGSADACAGRPVSALEHEPIDGGGGVGAARRAGVAHAVALLGRPAGPTTWVASTDADTRVGPGWLVAQLAAARDGAHVVAGAVDLADDEGHEHDPRGAGTADVATRRAWAAREAGLARRGVRAVHGANLGLRLDVLHRLGGFRAVPEHEDVLLVTAAAEAGLTIAPGPRVTTSARLDGRTPGGFAGHLRLLAAGPLEQPA